ncbi:phage protein NinX family protein, partial [Klebsiella pneumoniae]
MLIKTSELSGAALDWAVAKADGFDIKVNMNIPWRHTKPEGKPFIEYYEEEAWPGADSGYMPYRPSLAWAQGGPLIDKYQLTISSPKAPVHRNGGPLGGWNESGLWTACTWERGVTGKRTVAWDKDSPLIAACRAIVAAKLGD